MTKEQIEEKKTRERYYFAIRIKAEQKMEKAQKSIKTSATENGKVITIPRELFSQKIPTQDGNSRLLTSTEIKILSTGEE